MISVQLSLGIAICRVNYMWNATTALTLCNKATMYIRHVIFEFRRHLFYFRKSGLDQVLHGPI